MHYLIKIILLTYGLLLTACVYVPKVEQGQALTLERVQQIETGMNANQVVALLGTPLLVAPLNDREWIYPYYQRLDDEVTQQHYRIRFNEQQQVNAVFNNEMRLK